MKLFKWNDELILGIEEFDKEHKMVIDLLNYLFVCIVEGKEKSLLGPLIEELMRDTGEHFAHEEKLFKLYNYPKTIEHTVEHELFKKEMGELIKDLESGKREVTPQVMKYISDWVSNHIRKQDREYVKFLKEKGIK